jgi:hypothetical protein
MQERIDCMCLGEMWKDKIAELLVPVHNVSADIDIKIISLIM